MVRFACALLTCLVLVSAAHGAERRVALVIGNSAYKYEPLFNPGHDARAMAQALRESGFEVAELRNLSQTAMRRAIREFGDAIASGGIGLFYYAGHGMQHKGKNYLIPVGNDIQREDEIADQSIDVGLVLEKMRTARNSLNILILDACRNNPFGPLLPATGGLVTMDAPPRTIIAFSTAPGQVAADGAGDNSIYTKHLVAHMREPGVKLEDVFKRVRTAVRQESAGRQVPWENTSLEADFYFRVPDPKVIAAEQEERRRAQQDAIDRAVQEALKRRSEEAAGNRARIEKEIADRVAAERAAAEREVKARIAAIERAAQEAIERARQDMLKQQAAAEAKVPAPVAEAAPTQIVSTKPAAGPKPATSSPSPEEAKTEAKPAAKPPPGSAAEPAQASRVPPRESVRLASAARSAASIPAARAVALPQVGDTWTYKNTTRDYGNISERKSTWTVRAVTDSEIQTGPGRITTRYTHDWNVKYFLGRDGVERTFEPYIPEFKFPLEPGKSWQAKFKTSTSNGRMFDVSMDITVVGWEDVIVPAGTFKAIKVTSIRWYSRTDPGSSGGGRTVINRWFSPEVKRWVKSETLDMGNNGVVYNDNTLELMSYKVQ